MEKKESKKCNIAVTPEVWKQLTYIKWDDEYDTVNDVIKDLLKLKKGDKGE